MKSAGRKKILQACRAGTCVLLLHAAVPARSSAAVCEIAALEYAGPDEFLWLGEALPLLLENFCLTAGSPDGHGKAVRIEAALTAGRERASLDMRFAFHDGRHSAASLVGDLRHGEPWLNGLAETLRREGVLPAGAVPPPGPPTSDGEALRLFGAAIVAGDGAEWREYLEEAVKRDGTFYEARWLLAVDDYDRGDFTEALEGFEAVAAGRPALPSPLMNGALCLLRDGRYEEGSARLRQAAALRPASLRIALFQGRALSAAGRPAEAESVFAEILKRDRFPEEAMFGHALLAARLRGPGAVRVGIEELPSDGRERGRDFFHRSGQEAFGRGDLLTARAAFELARVADPDHNSSHLALAVVKYALGEYEEAVDDLSAAARDFGGDPDVYRYLGLSYEKLGNTEAAMESFRRSAEFLAQQGGGDKAKSLFIASLAESRGEDGFPPVVAALYLHPLAGFWRGEGVVRTPAAASPGTDAGAAGGKERSPDPPAVSAPETDVDGAGEEGAARRKLIGEKEAQAVRLAQEALAAQKALRETRGEKDRLAVELEKLRKANERLAETVLSRDEALLSLEVTLDEYRKQVDELQSGAAGGEKLEAAIGERERTIDALRKENGALQDGLKKSGVELGAMADDLEAEKERARRLEARLVEKEQEAEARVAEGGRVLEDRVAALEEEKGKMTDLLAGYRSDGAAWEQRERDLKEEQRELQGRISSLEREIGRLEQRLEAGIRAVREAEKRGDEQAALAAKMEEQTRRSEEAQGGLKEKLDEAREKIDRLEGELRQAGKKVSAAEEKAVGSREGREKISRELEESRKTGEGLQEKIIELEEALTAVERREADTLKLLKKSEKRLADTAGQKEGLDEKLRAAAESIAALEKGEADAGRNVKALEKKLAQETKKKSRLEEELAEVVAEGARLRQEAGESSGLQKEVVALGRERAGLREELKQKEAEIAGLGKRLEEAFSAAAGAADLKTEARELTERLERQRLRLEELDADNARLKSLTERMARKLRESAAAKHGGGDSP